MLCTHGHGDHIGDAVKIAKKHNPMVVGIFELCQWLQKKGAKQISPMNKGGTQTVAGIKITMVHAVHSCGIQEDDGSIVYGGEACGYVLELPGGVKLYHAGDTAVFGDMAIIRELYGPEIVLLPIGDHFTMGPREAAHACMLLQPKTVIPMHFGTFPLLDRPAWRAEEAARSSRAGDYRDEAGTDAVGLSRARSCRSFAEIVITRAKRKQIPRSARDDNSYRGWRLEDSNKDLPSDTWLKSTPGATMLNAER